MAEETRVRNTAESALLHDNTVSPRDNRRARGKAMRTVVTHQMHAVWKAGPDRRDPIDLLEETNQGRIAELIPLRYGRMMNSPFTFYRGSAAIMAGDLATTPDTGVNVQACGDCHLMNFGAFATPERNVVFDINDFDETLPAPWEWDVKRLTVSYVLAARDNGLTAGQQEAAAVAVAAAYRDQIIKLAKMSILDIWYEKIPFENIIQSTSNSDLKEYREKQLKKAQKRTVQSFYFPKLTEVHNGKYLIKDNPPVVFHPAGERGQLMDQVKVGLQKYRETLQADRQRLLDRYTFADIAMKVVGIGSVGTACAVALMLAPDNEPLLLQVKEARPSVFEPYVGKSAFENRGQRVVEGQRIVQSASDLFLGWTDISDGRHFYVRQLRDTKIKPEPQMWDAPQFVEAGQVMGRVLAKAHARSGDAAFLRGYLGSKEETFEHAIGLFSMAYADQVEADYEKLVKAVNSGKIHAAAEEYGDSV
jgi:uncharacterized protein (DUF2252 family)